MKVLHAVHNFPPEFVGGTEAYLAALVQRQREQGLDVLVVSGSEYPGAEPALEDWHGCRVIRLGHDPAVEKYSVHFQIPRLREPYRRILSEERPDLLHVHHYLNLGLPLVGAAAVFGIPAVVTLHDFTAICPRFFLIRPDGEFCGDLSPIPEARCQACCEGEYAGTALQLRDEFEQRRAFFEEELSLASKLLVPSEQAAAHLRKSGLLPDRLSFEAVPLGLLRELRPVPREPEPPGRLRLVTFGNLAPVKGVDVLLEALAGLAPAQRARLSLLLLGGCTDVGLARRVADGVPGLDLRHESGFDAGRLELLPAEADLAVFPGTAAETYALVVDEALSLGLPVIVSDRGAAAERAGGAGRVVPAGDAGALRAVILELLEHPGRLEELRRSIPPRIPTLVDHERRLFELYQAVLERHPERGNPGARGEIGS
jgi:glycosyltransferase involved in cell wall biosynthesis